MKKVLNTEESKYQMLSQNESNPHFNPLGHDIVLPNSKREDFEVCSTTRASFFHEYYHYLQAAGTTMGIFRFMHGSSKVLITIGAINERQEIGIPLKKFAEKNPHDDFLQSYLQIINDYNLNRFILDGNWMTTNSGIHQFKDELEYGEVNYKINEYGREYDFDSVHIARRYNGQIVAIPIQSDLLCEAQSEVLSCYMEGIEGNLINTFGKETSSDQMKYNTIPEFLKIKLVKFQKQLPIATFFCTDFALMTMNVDNGFIEAFKFLESLSKVPETKEEWTNTRLELESKSKAFKDSKKILNDYLDKKKEYLVMTKISHVSQVFLSKIETWKLILDKREKDPLWMFPWELGSDYFESNILNMLPASHVKFGNSVSLIGKPSIKDGETQKLLTSLRYFVGFLEGKTPICPYMDDKISCTAQRTMSCAQAPWSRGLIDSENNITCVFGRIGLDNKINESIFKLIK